MLFYGAGGHAKNVYDSLISKDALLVGVFDDDPLKSSFFGTGVSNRYEPGSYKNEKLIICIGDNQTRRQISQNIRHEFGILVHQKAYVAESVILGEGTVVMAMATIQSEVRIGRHCIINTGAIIEHDCIIDDFVHIGPGAVVCGGVYINQGVFIGANATILPGVKIGKNVLIGAGSVVLKNVPEGVKVAGNPARLI